VQYSARSPKVHRDRRLFIAVAVAVVSTRNFRIRALQSTSKKVNHFVPFTFVHFGKTHFIKKRIKTSSSENETEFIYAHSLGFKPTEFQRTIRTLSHDVVLEINKPELGVHGQSRRVVHEHKRRERFTRCHEVEPRSARHD